MGVFDKFFKKKVEVTHTIVEKVPNDYKEYELLFPMISWKERQADNTLAVRYGRFTQYANISSDGFGGENPPPDYCKAPDFEIWRMQRKVSK